MADVDIPDELHDRVKDYAQRRGISVTEAYAEIVEYALREMETGDDEDDDLKSGIA